MKAEICGFARGTPADIDALTKCGADSVFLVIPSSDIHIKSKLRKSYDEMLRITEESVQYAKDHGLLVELGPEDATRANVSFLKDMIMTAVEAGADRVTPPDTVGIMTPERIYEFFSELKRSFPRLVFGTHCHNDYGQATANSLSALRAGAGLVHVTVNGIGERAGNASLEEIAVSLRLQYEAEIGIKTERLYEASQLVTRLTGVPVQPNKAIVGENAFAHEAGIHTHAILNNPLTYEPIQPELVGRTRRMVAGKHSGSAGLRATLKELGLIPTDEQLRDIFLRVKSVGDRGKLVTDADLKAFAETVMGLHSEGALKLQEVTVVTGDKVTPTGSVKLSYRGKSLMEAAIGIGPVDAAMNAVRKAVSVVEPIRLEEYHVKAITGGTDALVEVLVRLRKGDSVATAIGADGDIVMASVEALIDGMNVLINNR